jgi:hypothetical protein
VQRTQRALGGDSPTAEARVMYRSPDEIESLFVEGFDDVRTGSLDVDASYSGFEEFWEALLGGAGPAGAWVLSLDAAGREAARAELHRQLGAPSGAFTLHARAWGTRATRA